MISKILDKEEIAGIKNRQYLLASRPSGMPTEDNFRLVETTLAKPEVNQVLVKMIYVSVDPYMQGRMLERKSYAKPYEINGLIMGGSVGEVIESRSANFKIGDYVEGLMGWQEYCVINDSELRKLDKNAAPLSTALGILGMTGLTAYFGITEILKPVKGETMVISGAAGAVGIVAG